VQSEIKARAIAHPEAYVMKPQREGGGNNLYGEGMSLLSSSSSPRRDDRSGCRSATTAMKHALETMPASVLSGHILMEVRRVDGVALHSLRLSSLLRVWLSPFSPWCLTLCFNVS
jgi:hypothetical protein